MIICLAHQKGGTGKSTIVWNLALELGKKNHVEVVDLDAQQTLFFANETRLSKGIKPLNLLRFENSSELTNYIRKHKEEDDSTISILDLGGFDSDVSRIAIYSADMVITPVSDRYFELLGIKSFEKILMQISEASGQTSKVNVLLNRINASKTNLSELKDFIQISPHFELFSTILRERTDMNKSVSVGKSVSEYDKDGKSSLEMKSLVKEIKKMINL